MSKKQTASKKQLRLTLFNLALMHNKKRFKAGTVFTAEELATMFYQAVPKLSLIHI